MSLSLNSDVPFALEASSQERIAEERQIDVLTQTNIEEAKLPEVLASQLNNSYISITSEMFSARLFNASVLSASANETHIKLCISVSWVSLDSNPQVIVPMGKNQDGAETSWHKLLAVCSYPLELFSNEELSGLIKAGKIVAEKRVNEEKLQSGDFPKVKAIGGGDFIFVLADNYNGGLRISKLCLGTPSQRSFYGAGMGATPINSVMARTEKRPTIDGNFVYKPEVATHHAEATLSLDGGLDLTRG